MYVDAPINSPVVTGIGLGTGASKYTDIVTKSINTLANPNASLDDQLSAYQNLIGLLFAQAPGGGELLAQTNANDYQRATDAFNNAFNNGIGQQIQQVNNQYGATIQSIYNPNSNPYQDQLDALSRFSQANQQIIFVAQQKNVLGFATIGGQSVAYATVADWKSALTQQAAAWNAQQATATATATAPSAANQSPSTASGVAPTTTASSKAKPAPASGQDTAAGIALQLILSGQNAKHETSTSAAKTVASRTSKYLEPGTTATADPASATTSSQPAPGGVDVVS
jgi:hypothetical protein